MLQLNFYRNYYEVETVPNFLGKVLVTNIHGKICKGRIVEIELYKAEKDKACHAYLGKKTNRNAVMYEEAGLAYTYICYGMHTLFNITLHKKGVADALLIRALEPIAGIDTMLKRCKEKKHSYRITKGPGKLSKAMGISMQMNGISLLSNSIYLEDYKFSVKEKDIMVTPRIGVQGAGIDANLPYRFFIKDNSYVSGKRKSFKYPSP